MDIDGLTTAINTLVTRFYGTHERCKYMKVVQLAKSENGALREAAALPSRESITRTSFVRQTRALNITQSCFESSCGQPIPGYRDAGTHLMNEYYAPILVPPSFIPSMSWVRESEEEEWDIGLLNTDETEGSDARHYTPSHKSATRMGRQTFKGRTATNETKIIFRYATKGKRFKDHPEQGLRA